MEKNHGSANQGGFFGCFLLAFGALAMIGKYQPMRVGIWAAEA